HQHDEHDEGDERTETQRKPFEKAKTHEADIVTMSAARGGISGSGSAIADFDVARQRLRANPGTCLDSAHVQARSGAIFADPLDPVVGEAAVDVPAEGLDFERDATDRGEMQADVAADAFDVHLARLRRPAAN